MDSQQQPVGSSAQDKQAVATLSHSLYDASPTPSEEGGGASPVKARMATRFFAPVATTPPPAAAAAVTVLTSRSNLATCSNSRSGASACSHVGTQQSPSPTGHLQDSIYGSAAGSFSQLSSSSGLHKSASQQAAASRVKGRLRHSQDDAGSHTSLLNVQHHDGAQVSVELYVPHTGEHVKDTFWPCTFNLSKVILGAGMMAIPKAFQLLGFIAGSAVMLLMALLTFFTLAGLVSATAATGAGNSYGALVRKTLGPKAEATLQFAVFANCYIMEIVFVVVLGDILVGTSPEFGGLLPEWTGRSPTDCIWLRRDVVLGAMSLLVLLPLAAMRSMEKLAVVNIIGVAANGAFAGLMLWLAAAAAANGVLQPPPLFPDWGNLGSTPLLAAVGIAVVVPVLLNCDVCHQSLHPLMPLLQPYSVPRMQRLVAVALGMCNTVYITIIVCSSLVFGEALEADVLANVNSAAMAPLIGPAAAVAMAACVRVGYLLSLVGSYVLLCYPLRQCLADQFLPGGQAAVQKHWLLVTSIIVVSAGAIGCYLPSIWGALALVGATTSTVQAFIIPGLVVLSVERQAARAITAARLAGARRNGDEQGLQAPLLGDAAEAEAGAAGLGVTDVHVLSRLGAADAAAGTEGGDEANGSFKVTRGPQAPWLCVARQLVALLAVVIGCGLLCNSVAETVWQYAHPHAEGMVVGIYRMLPAARFAQPAFESG